MYWPKPGSKRDPIKRWNRPDRIFFGFGACHILAGVFLDQQPLDGFYAEWIDPHPGYSGSHVYVTDGTVAFDYHGYSRRERLRRHYWTGWQSRYPGWDADTERVTFSLLDTARLNARKHLGPDQYPFDPIPRAIRFVSAFDHAAAYRHARLISPEDAD